jgi:ribosomal protein L16 Arg81 hydroxylase
MNDSLWKTAAPRGLFAELFQLIGWDEFVSTYWGQRPLRLSGCASLLAKLPALGDFPRLLSGTLTPDGWQRGMLIGRASFVDQQSRLRDIQIEPGQFAEAYSAGMSLCLSPIEHLEHTLTELAEDCRHSSNFPVGVFVTAYVTPRGARGNLHFDSQHVFLLQVSGQKHWRISQRPSAFMPPASIMGDHLEHSGAKVGFESVGMPLESTQQAEMEAIALEEGQCLYLPPGCWHEARTEAQASLHYTLTVFPVTFSTLIDMQLRMLMLERESWRRDVRFPESEAGLMDHLESRLAELRSLVAQITPSSLRDLQLRLNRLDSHSRRALGLMHGPVP